MLTHPARSQEECKSTYAMLDALRAKFGQLEQTLVGQARQTADAHGLALKHTEERGELRVEAAEAATAKERAARLAAEDEVEAVLAGQVEFDRRARETVREKDAAFPSHSRCHSASG